MISFSFMLQVNCKDHKLFILSCLHTPNLLMKPSQTLQNKAPNKGGKEEHWERTQVRAKGAITSSGLKAAKEQIMFPSPHQSQKTYHKRKVKGNLKA